MLYLTSKFKNWFEPKSPLMFGRIYARNTPGVFIEWTLTSLQWEEKQGVTTKNSILNYEQTTIQI